MDRQTITEHRSRPAQVQNRPKYTPKRLTHTTQSWKQKIAGSCLAILWLWSSAMVYGQENTMSSSTNIVNTNEKPGVFCNSDYIERSKKFYKITAGHCENEKWKIVGDIRNDISITPVSKIPTAARVTKILDGDNIKNGELSGQTVTVQLCVRNPYWEVWKNKYCNPFTGVVKFDSNRGVYHIEVPFEIKQWYVKVTDAEFWMVKMRSASGSMVEWEWKCLGLVSSSVYNPFEKDWHGLKGFESRLLIAIIPGKKEFKKIST